MRRPAARVLAALLLTALAGTPAMAQDRVVLTLDALFFGDNTEFRNPYREGDTIFGTTVRLAAEVSLGERTVLRLGGSGMRRFGSDAGFDESKPVVALEVRGARSTLVIGTFPPPRAADPPGPDRAGLHGLLPPLQRETLMFERPHEAGFLWRHAGGRLAHEAWLNWQRLNTAAHRERFDAGLAGTMTLSGVVAVPLQFHLVHEGGQLHASGAVSDSYAGGTGVRLAWPSAGGRFTLESLALASRHVPDRERPGAARTGAGTFNRIAFERAGLRAHLIAWRGDDFIKSEGDANYHALRRDGSRHRGIRDYAEVGLTRLFRPDARVRIEVSGRLHRVERHYEYSYRVVAVAASGWPLPLK